jgi:hypothetical protein
MAATTDNRKWEGSGSQLDRASVARDWNGPIKANVHLYRGQLVGHLFSDTNAAPTIDNWVPGGTMRCIGFMSGEVDNTGGPLGGRAMRAVAQSGQLIDKNAGGGNAIGMQDFGKPAFGADNQTCSKLAADGDFIGIIVNIDRDSGNPVILVDPLLVRQMAPNGLYPGVGAVLSVASNTIAPLAQLHHLGAGLVKTITPPALIVPGAVLEIVPDAAFTYDATGNISLPAAGGTATINKLMSFAWDGTKWTPSY